MAQPSVTERECSLAAMDQPGGGAAPPPSLAALVAAAHLAHDVPDVSQAELLAAAAYVDDSIAAMPDVTRAGVRVASAAAWAALSLLGKAPYGRQPPDRRSRSAGSLARLGLPVLGELTRLTRGLGLVSVYEQRSRDRATR